MYEYITDALFCKLYLSGNCENYIIGNRKTGKAQKMTINIEDLLNSIKGSVDRIEYIRAMDIPDIGLYMDQVTTFMDTHLKNTTREPATDKILTKTMINNYAKNNLLPPPSRHSPWNPTWTLHMEETLPPDGLLYLSVRSSVSEQAALASARV